MEHSDAIATIGAGNAHRRGWTTNDRIGIGRGHDRRRHSEAEYSREAKKGKDPST